MCGGVLFRFMGLLGLDRGMRRKGGVFLEEGNWGGGEKGQVVMPQREPGLKGCRRGCLRRD